MQGASKRFALINRNFLNYPLARDPHVRVKWYPSKNTGRWIAQLPDDERIRFSFPADVDEGLRRLPTGFDMNLLFLLLAEARRQKSASVVLPSQSAILKVLGFSVTPRNRQKLKHSLAFWSLVTIRFKNWRFVGRNGSKRFPPAIKQNKSSGVTIAEDWLEPHNKYRKRVELPLPRNAAAQNIALCLLTSVRASEPEPGYEDVLLPRRLRRFCRKVGLSHSTRNRSLNQALELAAAYFQQHGGSLTYLISVGKINFVVTKPNAERATPPTRVEPEPQPAKRIKRIRVPPTATRQAMPPDSVVDRIAAIDERGRQCYVIKLADGREITEEDYREMLAGDKP